MNKRMKKKHYTGTRRKRKKLILCAKRGNPAPKWFLGLTTRQLARYMWTEGYTIRPHFFPLEKNND